MRRSSCCMLCSAPCSLLPAPCSLLPAPYPFAYLSLPLWPYANLRTISSGSRKSHHGGVMLLSPLSSTERHGGNGYRGRGSWKRHKKKHFAGSEGPLDLTRILGNLDRHQQARHHQQHEESSRSKQAKALALRARLDSLSLSMAPSHSVPLSASTVSVCTGGGHSLRSQGHANEAGNCDPSDAPAQQYQQHHKALCVPNVRKDKPAFETCSRQQKPYASISAETASAVEHDCTLKQVEGKSNDTRLCAGHALPPSVNKGDVAASRGSRGPSVDALRVPNGATKMAVDDECNSEILGARATLRALHDEQKKLGDAMRRRRLELCLGNGSRRGGSSHGKLGEKPSGYGRRRRSRREDQPHRKPKNADTVRERAGRGAAPKRRCHSHAHPLLFMAEADVQEAEKDQMLLEDAGVTHMLKLEEARRRKQDYAAYYRLALSYGSLAVEQFEQSQYPGKCYQGKVLDAARVIQNWWWSVWPTLLRRRKAGALAIQSVFRGFLQRRKWQAIIRLRTLWGNTRIVAHSFTVWRSRVASFQRAKAFAGRRIARSNAKCLAALRSNAVEKRTSREKLLRERLRRVSAGLRLRVFEGWVRYTETSIAIERLRYRSSAQPAFRAWRAIAAADRIHCRLRWACATLASRLLRWRQRTRYTRLRASCVKIQVVARRKIASTRLKRATVESRTCRAKEVVQAREDVRVRRLIDVEQKRLDRLQAAVDKGMPLARKKARAFLGTAGGRAAVASTPAAAPSFSESEAEAKREVIRRFVWREQGLIRHDFNAASVPPLLRCPRSDCCDATFVERGHYLRHAADVHPNDPPEVAELSAVMRDPIGLTVLESFVTGAAFDDSRGGEDGGSVDVQARSNGREVTEQPLFGDDGRSAADGGVLAARDVLDLWKEVEEWRKVPSSSSDGYRKLAASIVSSSNRPHLPDDIRVVLGGEQAPRPFGKLVTTHKTSTKTLVGGSRDAFKPGPQSSTRNGNTSDVNVDPLILEEASSRAVTFLGESKVGLAFLRSDHYRRYLEGVHKPMKDAIEAEALNIAAAEAAEWAAEARQLRKAALDHQEGQMIDSLAGHALDLVLEGDIGATLLEGLVDDQASTLAVMIIAERSTFAKVISAVWNEAVEQAAHISALELCGVDPRVSAALSEAACSSARSRIMEELIDQCAVDLTGPEGELWPDARAMTAIADGLGYQVRSEVMAELIDAAVSELSVSGEAETLMTEADAARQRRQEAQRGKKQRRTRVDEAGAKKPGDGLPGGGMIVSWDDGTLLESGEEVTLDHTGQSETAAGASSVQAFPSVLPLEDAEEIQKQIPGVDDRGGGSSREEADGGSRTENMRQQLSTSGNGSENSRMTEAEAAVLVQSALRRKAVYRRMKTMVARNFIRMYDPGEGAFYWYNNATMESSWDKPPIIDLFFKKPAVAKSILCLGEKSSSTRSSIVSGFESSV